MSVQELSLLHRRYIDLSDRFKAAWTFHQFVQGLHKVFADEDVGGDQLSFQGVYASLKSVSQNLNTTATNQLREQLDGIGRELAEKIKSLLAEDNKISPVLLRQFFQRVKNYDEKILTQLLRFYVFTHDGDSWEAARLDKVDFLLTKLGEEIKDLKATLILRDPTRLKEVFQSLWAILGTGIAGDESVEKYVETIDGFRQEMSGVEHLEQLNGKKLVPRYRALKHELGNLFFEPNISLAILETNLDFKQSIQSLYQVEERRITAEYQEVFELERDAEVDRQLDQELRKFRQDIEKFERHLAREGVRLEELAHIRDRVRHLIPRLKDAVGSKAAAPAAVTQPPPKPAVPEGEPQVRLRLRTPYEELIGTYLRRLVSVLEASDGQASPKAVTVTPEVQPLRVQPREVLAFRRLSGNENTDRELEQFVLEAAAVRIRISEEAEEIIGILAENKEAENTELFRRSRHTTRLADAFERRFSHFINQALQDGNFAEAQSLQTLRMRLLRDYSGLWLLGQGYQSN